MLSSPAKFAIDLRRRGWAVDLWSRAREPMDNLMDGKLPPSTRLPTGSQVGRGPTGSTAPTATPGLFREWSRANERPGRASCPSSRA